MNTTNLYFFNNEDALVFVAKVNSRINALNHYRRALVRTDITQNEVHFLSKEVKRLKSEIKRIKEVG